MTTFKVEAPDKMVKTIPNTIGETIKSRRGGETRSLEDNNIPLLFQLTLLYRFFFLFSISKALILKHEFLTRPTNLF